MSAADKLHITENHFRVIYEIGVHLDAIFIGSKVYPFRLDIYQPISLLQKDYIGSNFCASRILKGVIGHTNCTEKICSLCDIFSHCRVFLIKRSLRSDKCHNTSGAHLIKRSGKEIIVNKEIVLVISLIGNFELPEGDVSHGSIEETVGKICVFKTLNGNTGILIELLCNPTGNSINFHSIKLSRTHAVRDKTYEVSDAARRLKDITGLEIHIFKRLIHRFDNNRRRIESGQR